MQQTELFDAVAGKNLRDRAIEQVGEHAPDDWMTEARSVVEFLARKHLAFTTDDVWAQLTAIAPREPRAMGAVMKEAERDQIIEPTGNWVMSQRLLCHRRPLRQWIGR
ncbi:MAG: hypothetical protein MUC88_00395 [Planctomycetes bacterium]|jgi:hypothetical protein|nr:hypothetical protein [Planctomycetota bacterium]